MSTKKLQILGSLGTKPDWNQNDETAVDYVKNRTHWIETGAVEICSGILDFSQQHWNSFGTGEAVYVNQDYYIPGYSNAGELPPSISVEVDGVKYECPMAGYSYNSSGSLSSYMVAVGDSDYLAVAASYRGSNALVIVCTAGLINSNFHVTIQSDLYQTLDDNFISSNIARVDEVAATFHAATSPTYGTGSDLCYGHVKLSSSIGATDSVDDGIAATPVAVFTALNTAKAYADENATKLLTFKAGNVTLPSSASWGAVTYGDGKFVAVPHASGTVAYSEDGILWTPATISSSLALTSVAYGNGKFVATVYYGDAAYSEDGVNWERASMPSVAGWNSVTYGNGKFVAVATSSDKAAYSEDGITWTQTTLPSSSNWSSVTYGNGKFVVVSNGAYVAYSEDAITWSQTMIGNANNWCSITYGNGKFVAVATGSDSAAYSEDGITWTISQTGVDNSIGWSSVTYGNGKFVAVPDGSDVAAYSEDGITWSQTTLPTSAYWSSIVYGSDKFVAVKSGDIVAYSTDGINWRTDYEALVQNNTDMTDDIKELLLEAVVYAEEDSTETATVPLNADTLGGRSPDEYALADDVSNTTVNLQTQIDNKAPAGFGLGSTSFNIAQDLDTVVTNGWYCYNADTCSNVPENIASMLFVENFYNTNYCRQTVTTIIGVVYTRSRYNGNWSDWECNTPPMSIYTEYRTNEYWRGFPVYTRLIDCGAMPTTDTSTWKAFGTDIGITKILRIKGVSDYGRTVPYEGDGARLSISALLVDGQPWITLTSEGGDFSAETCIAQVWYIKE